MKYHIVTAKALKWLRIFRVEKRLTSRGYCFSPRDNYDAVQHWESPFLLCSFSDTKEPKPSQTKRKTPKRPITS